MQSGRRGAIMRVMQQSASLRLYFFGAPRIERDGQVIETDTRKAVALLAYLAVTGEFHTREALSALFWPDMDDERGRAALRRTISSLKAAVGDDALYVSRDGLSIQQEGSVWCDINAFTTEITAVNRHGHSGGQSCDDCEQRLESAVALYRDHFLSGFSLRDSAAFDEWQLAQTEYLRRLLTGALATLVQSYAAAGEFQPAIEHTRRWLTIDPLREDAHRWLMQLYSWSGARDMALRQYRETIRVLDEELGVDPLPETTAIYEAIQEGALSLPAAVAVEAQRLPASPGTAVAEDRPQLIGRERAWDDLLSAYDRVSSTGQIVAVVGEAGIGKTHLASAFLEAARSRDAVTVLAPCYEGESSLALAPFAAALRALLRKPHAGERLARMHVHMLAEVARLLPELREDVPMVKPPAETDMTGAQARFFAAVSEVLCSLLTGPAPGILFIDDAQWADEASLDLLAYMARRPAELPILILVAWTGTGGSGQRLRRILAEAQRAGTGSTIVLDRWSPGEVAALVAENEDLRPYITAIADRLYRESEGLPFFVVEYLSRLASSVESWEMPPSVHDLLSNRLADTDETERQLLQTAAVIGRSFDYDTLWQASGRSEDEVIGGLERLLARGLVRELADDDQDNRAAGDLRYDFAHQQLRALVYEATNLARRRLLHRRVAETMQVQGRGNRLDARASLIGHHYRMGGQDAPAAEFYRRAGDYARMLYATREALEHYRTALALGHPAVAELTELVGDLHTLLGEYAAALHAYESVAAGARGVDLARIEHKLGRVYERRGQWELADSHLCAALEQYGASPTAQLLVDRSRVAYRSGNMELAAALGREALALSVATSDTSGEAEATNALGLIARQSGDLSVARDHLQRSLALAEAAGTVTARIAALNNLARLYGDLGDIDSALELLAQAVAYCGREGDRHHEAALYNHRADLLHRAGREQESMDSLKQAVSIYAEIGLESGDWQPEIWKLTEW